MFSKSFVLFVFALVASSALAAPVPQVASNGVALERRQMTQQQQPVPVTPTPGVAPVAGATAAVPAGLDAAAVAHNKVTLDNLLTSQPGAFKDVLIKGGSKIGDAAKGLVGLFSSTKKAENQAKAAKEKAEMQAALDQFPEPQHSQLLAILKQQDVLRRRSLERRQQSQLPAAAVTPAAPGTPGAPAAGAAPGNAAPAVGAPAQAQIDAAKSECTQIMAGKQDGAFHALFDKAKNGAQNLGNHIQNGLTSEESEAQRRAKDQTEQMSYVMALQQITDPRKSTCQQQWVTEGKIKA